MHTFESLMKEWLFSSIEDRYIHSALDNNKEIEIDIDGTIYLHINIPYNKSHFGLLLNTAEDNFYEQSSSPRHFPEDNYSEYYYEGDLTLLAHDDETISLEFNCSNFQQLDIFLRRKFNAINVADFIRKYCQTN